ncbi:NAD(P)H-hydrate dehydratase [Candidatus Roizmanbacteria bacterium]|nr:NAD(P)H-hydrate dehydratase [Candidatus Roizmanbacteria bacterium]
MNIHSSAKNEIAPFLEKLPIPASHSHKGQNGKLLIIGGSELFHAAVIWAAEMAAHMVDMVHVSSTEENNEVIRSLKKIFRNGIVIPQKDIPSYAEEDDVILMGPGMVREAETARFTQNVLLSQPRKQFVLDAGALQMLQLEWISDREVPLILTPHAGEFERLFGVSLLDKPEHEVKQIVQETAARTRVTLLVKMGYDVISNGEETVTVYGGNAGLTKGGTGDVLAGLTASLFTKTDALSSAVLASYVLKSAADSLYQESGYWFSVSQLISTIPHILKNLHYN